MGIISSLAKRHTLWVNAWVLLPLDKAFNEFQEPRYDCYSAVTSELQDSFISCNCLRCNFSCHSSQSQSQSLIFCLAILKASLNQSVLQHTSTRKQSRNFHDDLMVSHTSEFVTCSANLGKIGVLGSPFTVLKITSCKEKSLLRKKRKPDTSRGIKQMRTRYLISL